MHNSITSQFLRNNNALAKNITKSSVDFYKPDNTYLATMTRVKKSKYNFTSIIAFNEKLQKKFYKTVRQYFSRIYVPSKAPNEYKPVIKSIITEIVENDYTKGTSRRIVKEKVLETPVGNYEGMKPIKYSPFKILDDTTKPIKPRNHKG